MTIECTTVRQLFEGPHYLQAKVQSAITLRLHEHDWIHYAMTVHDEEKCGDR